MSIRNHLITLASMMIITAGYAQSRYYTKTATITFFSKTDLENIEAVNKTVTAAMDTRSGAVQFSVPMKAFSFAKGLMQEHFNENYVESDKYPNSVFKGTIKDNGKLRYDIPGTYDVTVNGDLTIHGVTRPVSAKGKINVAEGSITISSVFQILLSEYNISIPTLVNDKISKSIKINVHGKLEPLNR